MRPRATVILKRNNSFLFVREKSGMWLLPGGKVEHNELPISAAARELFEETNLIATSINFLFEYKSFSNLHVVFSATVPDTVSAKTAGEIHETRWVNLLDIPSMETSPATEKILNIALNNLLYECRVDNVPLEHT